MPAKEKVALIGSGNWGSAIATKMGINTARLPEMFEAGAQRKPPLVLEEHALSVPVDFGSQTFRCGCSRST